MKDNNSESCYIIYQGIKKCLGFNRTQIVPLCLWKSLPDDELSL